MTHTMPADDAEKAALTAVPAMSADDEQRWPWKFCGVPVTYARYRELEVATPAELRAWRNFYVDIAKAQDRSQYSGTRLPRH